MSGAGHPIHGIGATRAATPKAGEPPWSSLRRRGGSSFFLRTSDRQRHVRAELAVREAMVHTRSRHISPISTLLRRDGLRVESGHAAAFPKRLERVGLPHRLSL
jgi:transposase